MPSVSELAELILSVLARILSLFIGIRVGLKLPLDTISHLVVLAASIVVVWKSYDVGYGTIDLIEKHDLIMFQASFNSLALALIVGIIALMAGNYIGVITTHRVENLGAAIVLTIVSVALSGYGFGSLRRNLWDLVSNFMANY